VKLIVSDASPLIVIAKTELIPVLNGMVEEVIVPEESQYGMRSREIGPPYRRRRRYAQRYPCCRRC
jgi:predicted nucleic acid-binding protein